MTNSTNTTFLKFNTNSTVSLRTAADFRNDIGFKYYNGIELNAIGVLQLNFSDLGTTVGVYENDIFAIRRNSFGDHRGITLSTLRAYMQDSLDFGAGGSMDYPDAGIAVSTGSEWGTSITDNSDHWNTAYNDRIISATVTGSTTKTLTLNQTDTGIITASFSDNAGPWTSDANGGITYANNVGIGGNSATDKKLRVVGNAQVTGNVNVEQAVNVSSNIYSDGYVSSDQNKVQTLTVSSSVTMDCQSGYKATINTLTSATTITITNLWDGGEGSIEIPDSGGYAVTLAGSTGYANVTLMGDKDSPSTTGHTTVVYWRSGSTLYYGFIHEN